MPFVESGFGDGEFPVRELLSKPNRERIGFEVTFIRPKTCYPFPA